ENVEVKHADGSIEVFDLFGAALKSDISKNPVIKPGDSIAINKYDREVYISGEIRRPGAFQLLENENLTRLIETYSNGMTKLSDPERIYITRINTVNGSTETIYLDPDNGNFENVVLEDMDMIVVPAKTTSLPLVFFEGSLGMKVGSTSPISAKIPWPITENQRISTAIMNLPDGSITPVSDLENSFIIRRGEADYIPVDLEKIIYNHDYSEDTVLMEGDRIIIPMKLFTVYVGGSVDSPRAVPYIAGKTYLEYIQMAGGFNRDEHIGSSVSIFDREGIKHSKDRVIQPEDRIFAPRNSPEYYFNVKMGTYVITTAALLALIISLINVQQTYF
ncbi:MAG: SLBB domain-containing protein, partial [Spirochaetales bacterium]|nr:SLBB domain-containing protein [Spirochaetales bacterium]